MTQNEKEQLDKLRNENDILRGIIAESDIDCIYCGLPRKDMFKCSSGFPGCGRADDIVNNPNLEIPE
ncbi:MAG: hypothetical protein P4L79_09885 [Legionella sp.]|uniref:hypothetical protein n=1 Tax=Legionella sp. TaxID=459 RepID=UPI00284B07AF|nr:hypothetical protein [Legionella sp.]